MDNNDTIRTRKTEPFYYQPAAAVNVLANDRGERPGGYYVVVFPDGTIMKTGFTNETSAKAAIFDDLLEHGSIERMAYDYRIEYITV